MKSDAVLSVCVAAAISVIAICVTTYQMTRDPREAALSTCVMSNAGSDARVACANAIFGSTFTTAAEGAAE